MASADNESPKNEVEVEEESKQQDSLEAASTSMNALIIAELETPNSSNEITSLRKQWDALSESSRISALGLRVDMWISEMEEDSSWRGIEGPVEEAALADLVKFDTSAKMAADEERKVMETERRCVDLHMEIHELEITVAELKIKLTVVGRYQCLVALKVKHDYEERIRMLLKMLFSSGESYSTSSKKRICALRHRITELEVITQMQRDEIGALALELRKDD